MNGSASTIQSPFKTIGGILIDNRNPYSPGQLLPATSKIGTAAGGAPSGAWEPANIGGNGNTNREILIGDNVNMVSIGGSSDLKNRNDTGTPNNPYAQTAWNNGTIVGGTIIKSANSFLTGEGLTMGSYGGDLIIDAANNVHIKTPSSPSNPQNTLFSVGAIVPEAIQNIMQLSNGLTMTANFAGLPPANLNFAGGTPFTTNIVAGSATSTTNFAGGQSVSTQVSGNVTTGVASTNTVIDGFGNQVTVATFTGGGTITTKVSAGLVGSVAAAPVTTFNVASNTALTTLSFTNGSSLTTNNLGGAYSGLIGAGSTVRSALAPGSPVSIPLITTFTNKPPVDNSNLAPGKLPLYMASGGAAGIYAGVPMGVYASVNSTDPALGGPPYPVPAPQPGVNLYMPQLELAYGVQQRNAVAILSVVGLTGTYNPSGLAHGALGVVMVEQGAAGQTQAGKIVNTNFTFSSNGGLVVIDPPAPAGPSIDLGGATVQTVAPLIDPRPNVVVNTGGGTVVNGVVVVQSQSAFSLSNILSTGIVATDSTRTVTISLSQQAQSMLDNSRLKKESEQNTNAYYIAGGACQPFFLEDDSDTMMVGEKGTAFKENNRTVTLQQGKIVAMVGKQPIKVNTGFGDVTVAGNSAAIIQQTAEGVTRVANLSGKATTVTINKNGKIETQVVQAGEEICLADQSLSEEELIPVDGVDREPIIGSITVPGVKMAKNKFDQKMMVEKEKLLVCNAGSFYQAKSKINNLKDKVNKEAKPLRPSSDKPLMKSMTVPSNSVQSNGLPIAANVSYTEQASSDSKQIKETSDLTLPVLTEESLMKPISFKETSGASKHLHNVQTHTAMVKHDGKAVIGFEHPTIMQLQEGEIMVAADKVTMVKTPHSMITVNPNTIALITVENKVTKVRNLWELGHGEIRQSVAGKYVDIAAGEESILGWDQIGVNKALAKDQLGRRKVRGIDVPGGMFMQRAEIPLTALLQEENSSCLSDLVTSVNPVDKPIANKLVKMAAVIQQVTSKHGQYLNYAAQPGAAGTSRK
jgi:hypothetical protein